MSVLTPITQKQARIEVSALPGIFWTSQKGGKLSVDEVKYNDGNEGLEKTLTAFTKIENVTISKPYDPVNDGTIQKFVAAQRGAKTPFNIVVAAINADLAGTPLAGANSITFSNCTLVSYMPPQFDRDGSGLATVELTVAVNALPSFGTN